MIRVQPKGLSGLYGRLGYLAGRATAAQREAELAASFAQQIEQQQLSQQHQREMAQFEADLRLETEKRARLWEFEKTEIVSRTNFAREEQSRQRKLDSIDSAIQQLEKEELAGRMSEKETYPLKLKYLMDKFDLDVPTPLLQAAEKERYGVEPYWRKFKDYPEGSPERQLHDAKLEETISGAPAGTIPFCLDPTFMKRYPEAAKQAQEARGIFLSDEEFNEMAGIGVGGVGIRPEEAAPALAPIYQRNTTTGQVRVSYDGGKTWQIIG